MNWLVRLLTFVLFLCIAGAVGLAFVLERAARYPVEANFLTPWIEKNASDQLDGGTVSIQKTRIALQPGQGGARLLLTDVTATGGPVAEPLNIGEIAVAVSLPDVILGRLRLTRLTIDDLRFGARREADGTFAFSVAPRSDQNQTMSISGVPGLGGVAEASSLSAPLNVGASPGVAGSTAAEPPLDQLRALLLDRNGILSRFEELKLTGGQIIFDDAKVDERVTIHDATLTFAARNKLARLRVDGLFEAGSSFASGEIELSTPLDATGLSLSAQMTDLALSDLAAYLPRELFAAERTDPLDLRLNAKLTDEGVPQSFEVRRFPLGALTNQNATFAPTAPTMMATGMKRTGGAGGWSLSLDAPSATFASEPVMRDALANVFDFDGEVAGKINMDIAEDGRLLNLDFDTRLGSGSAMIPALYRQPVALSSARFIGTYSPQAIVFKTFELAPIINGRALAPANLSLSIETPAPQAQRVRIGFNNVWRLSVEDILALWPNTNEDDGRKWFRENAASGRTSSQKLQLDVETIGSETVVHDLQADINFAQGALKLTDGLGYTRNAAGRVVIDNGLFTIDMNQGGLGPVQVRDTRVRMDFRSPNDGRLALKGTFDGPIRESLDYLSRADVGLENIDRNLPIDRTSGLMSVTGDMSLSLAQPAAFSPDFDFRINATDLNIRDYLAGLTLNAPSLPIRITPSRVATSGRVSLGRITSDASLDLQMNNGELENLTVSAAFNGTTEDAASVLGPLPDYIKGDITGELTYVQDINGRQNMRVSANLGRASIDLSPLPYFKPVGQPATADAKIILDQRGLAAIESFTIDGPALHLLGRMEMSDDGKDLRTADLRNLIVGDSNLGRVSVVNEREFMQIIIEDGQLDGRPLIESILDSQGKRDANIVTGEDGEASGAASKPLLINITDIRRFVVPGGKAFTDIDLSATIDDGAVIQFALSAQSPAHLPGRPTELGNLRASLTPQANGFYRLSFQSDDAGSLFSTLDLTDEIRGGVIRVSADSALPLPKGGWLGSMELRNFSIVDAPIMVQLLSLASLTGILELGAGGGLQFNNLSSNFTYGNSALYLDDLRMAGPSLGLTTEGSIDFGGKRFALQGNVTPFNLVSEIAGAIPVFGQVLTGTDGGGLFSAGYKINGTFADPSVSVNPFQILTPGIYRQWFQDIVGN